MSGRRRLVRVDVEIGPCEECGKPAAWHVSDGLCDPEPRRATERRKPRRFYRGRRAVAFVDLDLPLYAAAVPDWETIALFADNAAAQVGL